MRKYIKNRDRESFMIPSKDVNGFFFILSKFKKNIFILVLLLFVVPVFLVSFHDKCDKKTTLNLGDKNRSLTTSSILASAEKKSIISLPAGTIKANPFLPYRDLGGADFVSDIPDADIVPPPEFVNNNSDAARVMDTIVSGILFDKYSPAAILNIEGNDYLVKKGDIVNNYKVLAIAQDSVTVKLGENVYKAGIGEILTEGTINHNDVSNLNNKFGGVK